MNDELKSVSGIGIGIAIGGLAMGTQGNYDA